MYFKMVHQKVTLSIDEKIYKDFKEFCEKNAIMLSKKIENIMKELMENDVEIDEMMKKTKEKMRSEANDGKKVDGKEENKHSYIR